MPAKKFDAENQQKWKEAKNEEIECKSCAEDVSHVLREDIALVFCNYCKEERAETWFMDDALHEWRSNGQMHLAKCAKCTVELSGKGTEESVQCRKCHQTKGLLCFSGVFLKAWILGWRNQHL